MRINIDLHETWMFFATLPDVHWTTMALFVAAVYVGFSFYDKVVNLVIARVNPHRIPFRAPIYQLNLVDHLYVNATCS